MKAGIKRLARTAGIILIFVLSFSLQITLADDTLPTAEDVNRLADSARQITETFIQQSFELRIKYEYKDGFLTPQDKQNLHSLAETAAANLAQLAQQQQLLRQQIEDYTGDDWEARFGTTGLWRKLAADIRRTLLTKSETEYYLAIACDQPEKDSVLRSVLAQVDSLSVDRPTPDATLLKGRALAVLAQSDPNSGAAAEREFTRLMIRSDLGCSIIFKATLERIRLLAWAEPNSLTSMAKSISQNDCKDDIELVLSLAFLQHRYEPNGLAQTISLWPEIERIYGDIILLDLSGRLKEGQDIGQISFVEAELAAQAASKNKPADYQKLLERLAQNHPTQTPLTLYAAAAASAESSPAKATAMFTQAAKMQQQQPSPRLDLTAAEIARQAVGLAYNLFTKDANNCALALSAFESYREVTDNKMDEDVEYLYCSVLDKCGRKEQAEKLLKTIAARPPGTWRNRARLDLIIEQVQQAGPDSAVTDQVLAQLSGLIGDCNLPGDAQNLIRTQAVTLYCELLLRKQDESSTKRVLEIASAEIAANPAMAQFKVRALYQLGLLEQAVAFVAQNVPGQDDCLLAPATELLFVVLDRIEQWQLDAVDFNTMLADCEKIAQVVHKHIYKRQTAQLLAEVSLFTAGSDRAKLAEIEKVLYSMPGGENVVFLRCRARLFAKRGNFREAAQLWAKICDLEKDRSPSPGTRSWNWWRAKYYQLDCLARLPKADKNDIRHTVEVLENSFTDIPPLWANRLRALRQS